MTPHERLDWHYRRVCQDPSDFRAHVPVVHDLALGCQTVVEFGVAFGTSTIAPLHAVQGRGTLTSYDLRPCPEIRELLQGHPDWTFQQADTRTLPGIALCDLLLIDTLHTAEQVYAELVRHAPAVRRYLVFHDTVTFGERDCGQPGNPLGLRWGIGRYLWEHPGWTLHYETAADHGLQVYRRLEA